MKHAVFVRHCLPLLAAAALLGGCEVHYKAQDDAMYYTDRAIGQYHKAEHFIRSRFDKNYHPEIDDLPLHLSNFDTFVCDGARQIVANFDRQEMTVSTAFERKNKFLTRRDALMPFTDGIYTLFVMEDGTLLVQRDGATILQHCRPLVADSAKGRMYKGGGGGVAPVSYEYTPTISPADYNRGDSRFDRAMTK